MAGHRWSPLKTVCKYSQNISEVYQKQPALNSADNFHFNSKSKLNAKSKLTDYSQLNAGQPNKCITE